MFRGGGLYPVLPLKLAVVTSALDLVKMLGEMSLSVAGKAVGRLVITWLDN